MIKEDITDLLERMESFEEKLNITFNRLFCEIEQHNPGEEYFTTIRGEVQPKSGSELKWNTNIFVDALDDKGRLLDESFTTIKKKEFDTFDTFELVLSSNIKPVGVRVYPRRTGFD